MNKLKYKLIEKGAADGQLPVSLIFVDKKDVLKAGITYRQACDIIAKDYKKPTSVHILDMDATTVTSDGIMMDFAQVAFASCDFGIVNKEFGFMQISEMPYSQELLAEEPHMKQWDALYPGKRLYRGPNMQDRWPRTLNNEPQTITGRIANNNTGTEVMDLVEMDEVLVLAHGMREIMKDDGVLEIGIAGPVISVGIGMIVFETYGRIFHRSFKAGESGHNSGEYAKTVKSDYPVMTSTKRNFAKYTLDALKIGLIPGKDLGCAPAVLAIAKYTGYPIDYDNINHRAWIELDSLGMTREWLEAENEILSEEEFLNQADKLIPGIPAGKLYNVKDISRICEVEVVPTEEGSQFKKRDLEI
ncbi:hypothetical protein AN644_01325 [Candidatus Epulonipiscium fishelsonii]|nr:hypothetical protein AN644_01325 [Epulopiscium sp. SCG-C06WGA-EpuloA1]